MIAISHTKWFEREFPTGLPAATFPNLLERLRGGPAVYRDRVHALTREVLVEKPGDAWSIQENVGHVLDLEPLWFLRVEDILAGAETLRPTDLANTKTFAASHNAAPIEFLLGTFSRHRKGLIDLLESLTEADLSRTALHPRLQTPMTIVDLAYFVAEHDIHHLVRISQLLRADISST